MMSWPWWFEALKHGAHWTHVSSSPQSLKLM